MSWQRKNLGAPEYERPTEPPQTCGILYGHGKRHAFSGPPEAAKTMVALICGLEHYRAGFGPWALVDFESGPHATRLMLEELGANSEEIYNCAYFAPEGPPSDADLSAIAEAGVTLVIIDAAAGAYDVSALDDMKRKDVEAWARAWVKPLWSRGISTLILDHVVKNQDSRGGFMIGSERKLGGVDVHIGFETVKAMSRGTDGIFKMTTKKDRPAHLRRPHPFELHLSSDPDTHHITWEFAEPSARKADGASGFQPTKLMEKVSRYLEGQTAPVTRSSIAKPTAVSGKREWVLVAVDALVDEGYAEATDTPSGKLISHIRLYSDVPDVPEAFPGVPGNVDAADVPDVPPPTGGNVNGNAHQDPEVVRLLNLYGEKPS